ncbi:MAG: hypothetical protein ABI318_18460 [Chthoniobacteraceae bacterium]
MRAFIRIVASLLVFACAAFAGPISAEGERLVQFLDSLHVEQHWIAGAMVEWRTGEPTGRPVTDHGRHTHCSQFAAAVCDRLGIYILRPPEHSAVLLANAQFAWLPSEEAKAKGWSPVKDGFAARDLANRGTLVVAVYRNHDPKKSGHIAIIRPSTKSDAEIKAEGPQITQAGGINRTSAPLKAGFANHPDAFAKSEVRYYAHAVTFSAEVK